MRDYRAKRTIETGSITNGHNPGERGEIAELISSAIGLALEDIQADPSDGLMDELRDLRQEIESLKAQQSQVTRLQIVTDARTKEIEGLFHQVLPIVLQFLGQGVNVALVGPAGAGKTTLARQCAEALGRPFFLSGAILQKYELTGYMDAQGRYVTSSFRHAFEGGGVFLWDEIDASAPDALVAFNSALENGHADFPDGVIQRHPDFISIAAANTYGKGADRVYVGRTQLDGATLDRFAFITMDYDTALEYALAGTDQQAWVDQVIAWRNRAESLKIRHIISPRASIKGAQMLRAGMAQPLVECALVWKGLEPAQIAKIKGED